MSHATRAYSSYCTISKKLMYVSRFTCLGDSANKQRQSIEFLISRRTRNDLKECSMFPYIHSNFVLSDSAIRLSQKSIHELNGSR